jgi:hypothetical protein
MFTEACQINPTHNQITNYFMTYFNIILSTMHRSGGGEGGKLKD